MSRNQGFYLDETHRTENLAIMEREARETRELQALRATLYTSIIESELKYLDDMALRLVQHTTSYSLSLSLSQIAHHK